MTGTLIKGIKKTYYWVSDPPLYGNGGSLDPLAHISIVIDRQDSLFVGDHPIILVQVGHNYNSIYVYMCVYKYTYLYIQTCYMSVSQKCIGVSKFQENNQP